MPELHDTESLRHEAILTYLSEVIHFDLLHVISTNGTIPDGSVVALTDDNHIARARFYEVKNGLGVGLIQQFKDPYRGGKHWHGTRIMCASHLNSCRTQLIDSSCAAFPCMSFLQQWCGKEIQQATLCPDMLGTILLVNIPTLLSML
jgi:hypothetical protein